MSSPASDVSPVATADLLRLYFATDRPGDGVKGMLDIWVATRENLNQPFGNPKPLPIVNSAESDYPASISEDECKLFLLTRRLSPQSGNVDVFVAERPR